MEQHMDCEVCGHTDHFAGVFASAYVPYSGRICFPCGAVGAEAKWVKEEIETRSGKESLIVTYEDGSYYQKGKPWITRGEVIEKLKEGKNDE